MDAGRPAQASVVAVLWTLAVGVLTVAGSSEAVTATVDARFSPERLGAPTVVTMGFAVATPDGQIPPPLTSMEFRYPANLGIITSGLGVATCDPTLLETSGPAACPTNSVMGYGSAAVQVPYGGEVVPETANIVLVAGPSEAGYVRLLVSATGLTPVAARIVMPTLLIAGRLRISVPLVPSLPEGPDLSVVSAHVALGGRLTYHERVAGRVVAYHPKGVVLPKRCPQGGFRFSAVLDFLDGQKAEAQTAVACPRRR